MATSPPFPAPPDRARARRLRARLVTWYRASRRDLPWRRTRDPYAIWVSEAMLQQTRVETVARYWPRFLERFPSIEALATSTEQEVLAAWSGLGYYRRARALRAAAQAIVSDHGARFPRRLEQALRLPGVGRYTAAAVLSIAFDQPRPLVDGNVERVFSRLFGLDAAAGSKALVDECWRLAERLVPQAGGAGEWNQALMELGATVCTPAAPSCASCPLSRSCRGRREGRAQSLPRPRARPAAVAVELEIAWFENGGRVLLERRPPAGLMGGMWQLPTRQLESGGGPGLFPATWVPVIGAGGMQLELGEELCELRHSITHHRIRARVRPVTGPPGVAATTRSGPGPLRWTPRGELDAQALTGMTRKVLEALAAAPARGLGRARALYRRVPKVAATPSGVAPETPRRRRRRRRLTRDP